MKAVIDGRLMAGRRQVVRVGGPMRATALLLKRPSPLAPCDSDHDQSRHKHDENK
jgi:hypothetical protein